MVKVCHACGASKGQKVKTKIAEKESAVKDKKLNYRLQSYNEGTPF